MKSIDLEILPPGVTIPDGWSMPGRAEDWQRQCLRDKEWCRVFKYLFKLKTGVDLDELEDILFAPEAASEGELNPMWHLLLYITTVLLLTGLIIGGTLAVLNLIKWYRTGWMEAYKSTRGRSAKYVQLNGVQIDKSYGDVKQSLLRDVEKKA